ncbi:twin-arginine translocase TatA/TatE family subunit [Rarobacter incanus]|uniref:Sec-independent protein translocase protein TatA n=1 Tax=Rarobacter incanus TaxID=153494 RepID=A0A542SN55_9MICO|nr:twin-arginine translocase TatA/TatE family subunit [Rarobacter incanus]TQK75677.1 sec-independent protein translocase protein TatA [Rarobacter incanus]
MPGLREPSHWIILIIVLVIVFGAARLPSIAKNLGQSMKVFRKEMKDLNSSDPTDQGAGKDDTGRDDHK